MNSRMLLKVLGMVATIGGAALAVLSDYVNTEQVKEEAKDYIDVKFRELNNEEEGET